MSIDLFRMYEKERVKTHEECRRLKREAAQYLASRGIKLTDRYAVWEQISTALGDNEYRKLGTFAEWTERREGMTDDE